LNGVTSLFVCSLPGCGPPRPIGPAQFDMAVSWTPDGRGVAYARDGNLWVQPLSGRAASAHTLHRRPSDSILCVVARRPAPGHRAIDRHQRHRAVRGLELETGQSSGIPSCGRIRASNCSAGGGMRLRTARSRMRVDSSKRLRVGGCRVRRGWITCWKRIQ
jgi:hypothetical protein